MVVAVTMNKPTLTVSVSDDESSSVEESEISDTEEEVKSDDEAGDDDSSASEDNNELIMTNEGWADSVAKILGSSKPKNKKTLVLSRAKKYSEVVKTETEEKPAFEVIGDEKEKKESKPEVKKEAGESTEPPAKKQRTSRSSCRVKPNILEKDRERILSKIATKGVVQLFNAVRNQQRTIERQVDGNGLSENKKDKILKKFDKRAFLDTLMGQTKSVIVDDVKKAKKEVKDEEDAPKWSALRDDFMSGAKLKDWDKESVDE